MRKDQQGSQSGGQDNMGSWRRSDCHEVDF